MESVALTEGHSDFSRTSIFKNDTDGLLSEARGYKSIKGNFVHETAVVNWDNLLIGINNIIGPYVCIGEDAENITEKSNGIIRIGNGNVFREHTTINLPINPSSGTIIGDRNYLMAQSHVAHDCLLEDDIVMCNQAALGGHVHVMKGAVLALNTSVHQFQVIGSWSMVGMNSCVTKTTTISPGFKYIGIPARKLCPNKLALSRNKVDEIQLVRENKRFEKLKNHQR